MSNVFFPELARRIRIMCIFFDKTHHSAWRRVYLVVRINRRLLCVLRKVLVDEGSGTDVLFYPTVFAGMPCA